VFLFFLARPVLFNGSGGGRDAGWKNKSAGLGLDPRTAVSGAWNAGLEHRVCAAATSFGCGRDFVFWAVRVALPSVFARGAA
jgi:hypothetical protein